MRCQDPSITLFGITMTFDRETIKWRSKNGKETPLPDIPYRYLVNILGYLLNNKNLSLEPQTPYDRDTWMTIISEEMNFRDKARGIQHGKQS